MGPWSLLSTFGIFGYGLFLNQVVQESDQNAWKHRVTERCKEGILRHLQHGYVTLTLENGTERSGFLREVSVTQIQIDRRLPRNVAGVWFAPSKGDAKVHLETIPLTSVVKIELVLALAI